MSVASWCSTCFVSFCVFIFVRAVLHSALVRSSVVGYWARLSHIPESRVNKRISLQANNKGNGACSLLSRYSVKHKLTSLKLHNSTLLTPSNRNDSFSQRTQLHVIIYIVCNRHRGPTHATETTDTCINNKVKLFNFLR